MKYRVFLLFGKDKRQIFSDDEVSQFSKIKDEINIYEFKSLEEAGSFRKSDDN